jgi:iron complex outermembrane recepter protein
MSHSLGFFGLTCSTIALAGATVTLAAPAQAREDAAASSARIILPAGKLPAMLSAIAHQGRVRIGFDHQRLADVTGQPVDAATTDEAIRQAIAGTSLLALRDKEGHWQITAPASGEIVVRAHRNEAELSYDVNKSGSSTRDGKDLRSQPQATTVVTGKLMADEQVQNLYDAMQNVAGATIDTGNVQGAATFNVRGFLARPLTDGLSNPGAIATPVVGVERVEVLKGPAAILAGSDNLGGTVNVVMKKPFAAPLLNVSAEVGSYADRKFTLDGSTALDPDKKFSARLIVETDRADHNFAGYNGRFENFINPMLRFFDGKTDLTLSMQASDVRQPMTPSAAFDANGQLHDLSAAPVGQADQGFRVKNLTFTYDLKHDVNDWLTFVSRGQNSGTETGLKVYALGGDYGAVQLFLGTNELQRTITWADDTYLRAKFRTFGIKHTVSAGINYSKTTLNDYVNNDFNNNDSVQIVSGFFANPYGTAFPDMPKPLDYNYSSISRQVGYYAQDFIEYGPLHVLAALRHTDYRSQTVLAGSGAGTPYTPSATTPTVGAVLDVTKSVSLYTNFMRGFIPQFLFDANHNLLPPERSRNLEAGVKFALPGKVSATLSAYNLQQTNYPLYVSYNVYTLTAGQRSKGVELDLSASPLKGWDLTGSYSYATYDWIAPTKSLAVVTGQPQQHFSLFSRYTVQDGAFKNLGGSVGAFGASKSFAGTTGSYVVPGGTRVDAHLYYKLGPVSGNLGISNLFDRKLYGVATSSTYIPVAEPRTFRVTLTYAMF